MSDYTRKDTESAFAIVPAMALFGVIAAILFGLLQGDPPAPTPSTFQTAEPRVVTVEPTATSAPTQTPSPEPVAVAMFDPALVDTGRGLYQISCAACHGPDAHGIPGLGKDLVASEFMDGLDEDGFVAFVNVGRSAFDPLNTTGIDMPAKGVNPSLTDDDIRALWSFLRSETANLEAPAVVEEEATTEGEADTTADTSTVETAAFTAIVPDGSLDASVLAFDPQSAYMWSCSGCHGVDGGGADGLGPALSESDLINDESGDGIFEFLTDVSPVANPEDSFPHPYRAEPLILSDAQIRELIAYIFTLME
jgi:disulfide bond formation protein DsbB